MELGFLPRYTGSLPSPVVSNNCRPNYRNCGYPTTP